MVQFDKHNIEELKRRKQLLTEKLETTKTVKQLENDIKLAEKEMRLQKHDWINVVKKVLSSIKEYLVKLNDKHSGK